MSINFAKISIMNNDVNESTFNKFTRLFGYEPDVSEGSNIIISFDDDIIFNVKDTIKDFHFEYLLDSSHRLPIHFRKLTKNNNCNIFFKKKPFVKNGTKQLNFTQIFKTSEIFKNYKLVSSCYNCIYYSYKNFHQPEIFSIVKILSNINNPQFLLAYDYEEFNKDEIIYLVNSIFKNKYNNTIL
jgi:hypothetical protein